MSARGRAAGQRSSKEAGGPPRRFGYLLFLLCLLGLSAWFVVQQSRRRDTSRAVEASALCYSSTIWLRHLLLLADNANPNLVLPACDDVRVAMKKIFQEAEFGSEVELALESPSASCPESYWRDDSAGYVYVGGGLRLHDVIANDVLVIFCPAGNHLTDGARSRAIFGSSIRTMSTPEEMAAALEQALARAAAGAVSYSPRARSVLETQLRSHERLNR